MARKSTGGVVEKFTRRGTSYGIRFRALGRRQFIHVGYAADGVTRADAQRELSYVREQVRRGEWRPPAEPEPVAMRQTPTFHEAASEWFEGKRTEGGRHGKGLSPSAEANLRWQLSNHLLPTFAKQRLDAIGPEDVDRWRRAKVREGKIGATSINTCLRTMAAIFEQAVEYGHVDRNPAKGRRRRLPAVKPRRTYLDRAEHIAALLDAARELDRDGRAATYRRPLLAVLVLAGLRIDEALRLRWRHVDLARGVLRVPGTKTDAAERTVNLLPLLRDELASHAAARARRAPEALVFGTSTGGKQSPTNVRRRVLAKAAELANDRLAERDAEPLPEGLTPHSLRRTFASLLYALGEAPPFVMAQMGHTNPNLALAIYAREMDRRDGEPERLRALVEGSEWAPSGTSAPAPVAVPSEGTAS
jgi:integrase